ncbi:MAG: hypothetical protein HYX68_00825 [Planctomycetes bacterium]|nr:hypothetical protein [Planctomycetota bacterium]
MSREVWNDDTRRNLVETLRWAIIGELRMAKRGPDEILEFCREVYIQDDCPEDEYDKFIQFTADEINRGVALLESEMATWPEETDCDRLDRVEIALRDRGILLWQASPCCDTCTGSELPDRIDVINDRYPGFRDGIRGYAFFIDQNMPEMLAENTLMSVYLAYGWYSRDDSEVAPDLYKANALGIAQEVCDCLRDEGFEPDWDGDLARKIGVSISWRRRKMLE